MAHKLLAPFKKFPQQIPIFKKSSDKCKDASLFNYNAIYGMLDDVTSQSFDDYLHLLAIGTKRGEIKIYGSEGIMYTLVGTVLKSIKILQFLQGQGRLLSVTSDNDVLLWEYKVELSSWEVASTLQLGSLINNCNITTFDVSRTFSWKSDDDNLIQLLLIGMSNSCIRQVLIIGNRFHVYDGDDLTIDCDGILARCSDINKEYEFGEIMSIKFNSINNEKFFVAFSNGLLLFMKSEIEEPKSAVENGVPVKENEELKAELTEDGKEQCTSNANAEVDGQHNGESKENSIGVEKENDNNTENGTMENEMETEKPKNTDNTQKIDEVKTEEVKLEEGKVEVKAEVKKLKESVQVPYVNIKLPVIINYTIQDKKINSICWNDDEVATNFHESNDICFYIDIDGNGKQVEHNKIIAFEEANNIQVSNINYFKRKNGNMLAFVSKTEDSHSLLCLVTGNHIDVEFETPSKIIDYVIVKENVTEENPNPNARALLILCESQLIAVDLTSDNYTELDCPYLVLRNRSPITAVTSVIQVSSALFSNHKTAAELFQDWPLNSPRSSNNTTNEEYLDIIATGHSDGAITLWEILPSGIISVLRFINSCDLFKDVSTSSDLITENSFPRRQVGHHLIKNDDILLQINNIQLIHNSSDVSSDISANGLFCVAGNYSGTVFVFKYDKFEVENNLVEIISDIKDCCEKENFVWNDVEAPELLECCEISSHIPNLTHIIKLNPSLPVTSLAFKSQWNILAIGCTYGFVLLDLKENNTIFSYSTITRASKNNIVQAPLTVGQQFKKSMRQSFRKLKKLKPSTKHTYTVNEDKLKDKSKTDNDKDKEDKPEMKLENGNQTVNEDDKKPDDGETVPERAEDEDIEKNEDLVKPATTEVIETTTEAVDTENEPPIEISRKDKPSGTVGSLLIEATNLVSAIKEPCLFVGTNMGAIYAFELSFGLVGPVTVTLSKELHLQHKAPVLLIGIVNSSHVPLICTNEVSSYQRKRSVVEEKNGNKLDDINDTLVIESELELGPSGDIDEHDAKLKSGTLPMPPKCSEDGIEKTEPARKSVDAGKDKRISPNTTMKKSGTLPASFLQAIGKTPGNSDAHELLVVSEEQVKLFSLPSLKAKYKYKVVDTGHHFSHTKSNNIPENELTPLDKKTENTDTNNIDSLALKKQIRRISTVGLCKVPNIKTSSNKWGVSIALTNGEIIALTLNNLKKYFSNIYNAKCPILSSLSNGETNLVLSLTHQHNIQITDFSQQGIHYFEPIVSISIPESARPLVKVEEKHDLALVKTELPTEEIKTADDKQEVVMTNGDHSEHMNGHAEVNEMEEGKDQLGDETIVQSAPSTHHGDVTMDSIKEYITNMDGNVIVKTFDSSPEKPITANDGDVVTSLHEKPLKDGEVINDDTLKITTDNNCPITSNE